ncbi:hypothetical protein ACFWBX_14825 [Streptomyces sp. NPDC059991]|uniref:hypothetical protein n=1 Tax=Streptomyces sp. NPDC059991 TaxID=3347028 RepID=UPI0036C6D48F
MARPARRRRSTGHTRGVRLPAADRDQRARRPHRPPRPARPISADQLTDALRLVDTVAQIVIATAAHAELPDIPLLDDPGLHFVEVHQATGLLAARPGSSCDHPLIRLRGHAFSHDRPLLDVAREVLARQLRLGADGDGSP